MARRIWPAMKLIFECIEIGVSMRCLDGRVVTRCFFAVWIISSNRCVSARLVWCSIVVSICGSHKSSVNDGGVILSSVAIWQW